MKTIYFHNEDWEPDYVKAAASDQEFVFCDGPASQYPDFRDDSAEGLSVFVNSTVNQDLLDRLPNLKLITTRSTGYDNIDLALTAKRGIVVCNVPSYGENTVAEFAFAHILNLSRRIYDSYFRIAQKGDFSTEGLRGFDLKGKTLGIIGAGRIGTHVARMAKGFGMNILAYDKFENKELVTKLGLKYVSLNNLLAQSDIITLHAPLLPETEHLINLDNIGKIKRGAYLINTARGGLVDTTAIVKALREGILAGAGLDVLEEENYMADTLGLLNAPHPEAEKLRTLLENHYLIDHPRVYITPHNAFNTDEAIKRIIDTTLGNIMAFRVGDPANVVKVK